jgi:hypothetical protein
MAGEHSLRPGLNQEAENIKPIFLRQCRQNAQGVLLFHISIEIETCNAVKSYFKSY